MKIPFNKNKIRYHRGKKEATLQRAERDWLTILITAALCVMGISVYHVYVYNLVETGAFYGDEKVEAQKSIKLDVERLERIMVQINGRKNWPQVIASTTLRFVDPSE